MDTYINILLKYNFKLYREDNNKLVPIILDRLQSYYTLFCEENEINQNIQKYQNTNCDQSNCDTVAPSPKNNSNSSFFLEINY